MVTIITSLVLLAIAICGLAIVKVQEHKEMRGKTS